MTTIAPSSLQPVEAGHAALTPREQDVFDAIVRYLREHHGRPPSFTDLMGLLGVRSRGHIHLYLTRLEGKGCIERDHAQARSIRLTGVGALRPVPLGAHLGVPLGICPHCGQEVAA